jgi:hypothetical protein
VGDENTVARVLEETGGFGADYTFEATGLVSVMRQAVEAARTAPGRPQPRPAQPAGLWVIDPSVDHV